MTALTTIPPRTLPDALARIAQLEAQLAARPAAAAPAQRDLLLAHLPVGVLLLDDTGRAALLNDEYCRLLGLPLPAAQWLGAGPELTERVSQLFADPAGFVRDTLPLRQAPTPQRGIMLALRNGRIVERDVTPVPYGAGTGLLVHYRDVTEREQVRQALVTGQEFMQQVLDATPSVIYVRDEQSNLLFQNPACQQLLAEAVLAVPPEPGSVRAQELAAYAAVDEQVRATGQQVSSEDRLTMPDGAVRWFQTEKRPLDGGPDGKGLVLGVSTDITALKNAQLTLARSEKSYRDLMHYAQALICTYDLRGRVRSVNPALAALLREPAEALPGRQMADFLVAADQPGFGEYLARIDHDGEAQGVSRVQPSGQAGFYYLLYHNFVVREPGQEPYIISHAHDITDRVLAEQATERARAEAEALAEARQSFLASMSHEIRTPLNGVLGVAAQLAKTPLSPTQRELLGIVQASGKHLLALLNDVLDLARLRSGRLELEQLPFDLCESAALALQPLALQAADKGLTFEQTPWRRLCPLPWVVGDAHRLNQILLNLVGNALKFTPAGGTVEVGGELLAEAANALTVRFWVQDTGIGIAPEQQAAIFEQFTQAEAGTHRQYGGTGLGLSIARALVEQLGGRLTLDSTPGRGSRFEFTLTLPRAAAPGASGPSPDGPAPAYNTGQLLGARVLLVEDNPTNRLIVRLQCEAWGAQLVEAADGPAALARLRAEAFDLVLMDIQLPGLDGVEVTQRLRELPDPARAATPVLALTANAFQADTDFYLAAGLDDCLAKPFEEAALYGKLAALRELGAAPRYELSLLWRQAQGKAAFVQQILTSLRTHLPRSLAQLRAAAAAGRWDAAAELAHHIKPNLLTLSVRGVGPALALLTRSRRSAAGPPPNPAALAAAARHLTATVARTLAELTAPDPAS